MQNKHPLPRRIKIALGMLAAGVLLTLLAPKIPLVSSPVDVPVPDRWQGEVVRFTVAHNDMTVISDAVVTFDSKKRLTVSAAGTESRYVLPGIRFDAAQFYHILQHEKQLCIEETGVDGEQTLTRLLITDPLLRAAGKVSPSVNQPCSLDIQQLSPRNEDNA